MESLTASKQMKIDQLLQGATVIQVTSANAFLNDLSEDSSIDTLDKEKLVNTILESLGENCFMPKQKRYIKRRHRPDNKPSEDSTDTLKSNEQVQDGKTTAHARRPRIRSEQVVAFKDYERKRVSGPVIAENKPPVESRDYNSQPYLFHKHKNLSKGILREDPHTQQPPSKSRAMNNIYKKPDQYCYQQTNFLTTLPTGTINPDKIHGKRLVGTVPLINLHRREINSHSRTPKNNYLDERYSSGYREIRTIPKILTIYKPVHVVPVIRMAPLDILQVSPHIICEDVRPSLRKKSPRKPTLHQGLRSLYESVARRRDENPRLEVKRTYCRTQMS